MHPRPAYMKWGAYLGILIAVGALIYVGIRHALSRPAGSAQAHYVCPKELFPAPLG
jgi:hypothetical protein